jgi:hypothetical protein
MPARKALLTKQAGKIKISKSTTFIPRFLK